MTKVLVDSNILVYFAQTKMGEKNEISANKVTELAKNGEMCLSAQNLAEFSRVMAEKVPEKMDGDLINEYIQRFSKFSQVLTYSSSTVILANSISKKHKIHFFDALLVATMKENSVGTLLTENVGDFSSIKEIEVRNPFEREKKSKKSKKDGNPEYWSDPKESKVWNKYLE